jgi:hypothetical protein
MVNPQSSNEHQQTPTPAPAAAHPALLAAIWAGFLILTIAGERPHLGLF